MSGIKGYKWLSAVVALILVLSLTGCGGGGDGGQQDEVEGNNSEVTVLAASSLTDTFEELATLFQEQNPGTKVRTSFGGSSELPTQIEQGAPADVFASADEDKMDIAVQEDLVNEPLTFARNWPVLIVPKDNPTGIQGLQNVAKPGTKLVLAQDGVPIAEYAKHILSIANSGYESNFEQQVMGNIVSREANVRASTNRVTLGEADATFVYRSDVTEDIRDQVQVIEIPENVNVMAIYPIATIAESQHPELAQEWIDLVLSDEGQRVLEEYGFERAR